MAVWIDKVAQALWLQGLNGNVVVANPVSILGSEYYGTHENENVGFFSLL